MSKLKLLSEDEAIAARQGVANEKGVIAKGVPVVAEVVKAGRYNAEVREARFVMSAEIPDRMGDIVVQEGLNIDNFLANPQALLFHNSRSWPIGTWKDVVKNLTGRPKRTEGTMKLLDEGDDPDADRAARHLKAGTMRTVSIGFRPNYKAAEAIRDDDDRWVGIKWNEGELLECSLVPIPALPAAAMKEMATGMLSPETIELIKGVLEEFSLDEKGAVARRDELADVVRQVEGRKTIVVLPDTLRTAAPEVESALKESGIDAEIRLTRKAGGGDDDGEGVPVQTDPADTEKQKAEAAQIESSAEFLRMEGLVKEAAKTSKEPGIFASLLASFRAPPAAAPPAPAPTAPAAPEVKAISDEEKAALRARVERTVTSAAAKAAEPDPV